MEINRPDELFDLDRLRSFKFKGTTISKLLIVVAVLIILFGSFYMVQPEEVGVVLRFGRYVRTSAHLNPPFVHAIRSRATQTNLLC
jgi:regulator of protease activity HflC (stomatin/prohibitin superfamily)